MTKVKISSCKFHEGGSTYRVPTRPTPGSGPACARAINSTCYCIPLLKIGDQELSNDIKFIKIGPLLKKLEAKSLGSGPCVQPGVRTLCPALCTTWVQPPGSSPPGPDPFNPQVWTHPTPGSGPIQPPGPDLGLDPSASASRKMTFLLITSLIMVQFW